MNDNTHSTREVSLPPGVSYSELRRKFHVLKNVSKREFLSRPQLQIQVLGERLDGGEQPISPQPGTQLSAGTGMPTQGIPQPQAQGNPNQFAYGGTDDYYSEQKPNNEGLVEFAGGGTHEQNSNGGIPQGYDNQGNLNTVEDGETKYSFDDGEYIFSNRISTDGKFQSAQQAAGQFAYGGPKPKVKPRGSGVTAVADSVGEKLDSFDPQRIVEKVTPDFDKNGILEGRNVNGVPAYKYANDVKNAILTNIAMNYVGKKTGAKNLDDKYDMYQTATSGIKMKPAQMLTQAIGSKIPGVTGNSIDALISPWTDKIDNYLREKLAHTNKTINTINKGRAVVSNAYGGGLTGQDRGTGEKAYPSVQQSDFAGGHRSYPIPTEADAIDALRLAGLHGRDDVRARVFAKYPQLQHANGGHIDREMDDYHDTLYNTPLGDDFANSEPIESPMARTIQRAYGGQWISHAYGAGNNLAYAEGGEMNPPTFNQAPQGSIQSITPPTVMSNIISAAPKKVDPRFANAKPILNERDLALTSKETIEKPKQTDTTNVVRDGELYEKHINDEVTSRVNKYNKRSNNLDVQPEHIDTKSIKTEQSVKQIQQHLVDAGYNLNPMGKFKNDGVDGKMGKITKQAIEEFNKSGEKGKYTSYKSGKGELGECKEKQCSEYAQNEIYRNLKPNVDRATWNSKTGLTGDAWIIGKNIEKAGGKKVSTNSTREGDVITMFTGNSPYIDQAKKHGTDATHIGVVDKVNPDGSYYVLHNVHSGDKQSGYKGHEKRSLVKNGKLINTEYEDGRVGTFAVRAAYRPNYNATDITGKNAKVREDVSLRLDKAREKELQGMDNSIFGTDVKKKVDTFMEPLNSIKNKRVLAQKHNLSETEYQSLAKASLGILGQESSYDTSAKRVPKQMAASLLSEVGIKKDEASKGANQLKYKTNYGDSDLTELGISKANFEEEKNVPLVTFDLLAANYRKYLSEGLPKEKAIYKAVEKYNKGHASKSSDTQDSDYVNKVMHYAGMFDTVDKEGTSYNTLVDKVNLGKNTVKRQRKMASNKR